MSALIGASLSKPTIESVTIPDIKKRRVPNKFYVYKIIVQWSNAQTIIVYRRYSNFFDFWCKLKEHHASMLSKSFSYQESHCSLPDMPGKIYLGRSQVHQVAEKRRKKLQDFCQHLVRMPSELSQSSILYGFFSLWPDDTISGQQVRRLTASGRNVIKPNLTSSVQMSSPAGIHESHPLLSPNSSFLKGLDQSLPLRKPRAETIDNSDLLDESDEPPQYRVVQEYSRLDAQQLDLKEGQVVTVVEMHDTGWWMVELGEEQGYAPASVLVPLNDDEPEPSVENTSEEADDYVAVESYSPCVEDEVPLMKGDIVQVLAVILDGWWKVKKGDMIGFAPASILRKKGFEEVNRTLTRESQMFLNDRTLLRCSTRFPPRMSFSKQSFMKKMRRYTEGTKKILDAPEPPQRGERSAPDEPHPPPQPLPAGIQYRYEFCQPAGDVKDEDSEGYYKVPRSLGINFNTSNNLSEETAEMQEQDKAGEAVDIYNMILSPPIRATDESLYSEIPPHDLEYEKGSVSPETPESGQTLSEGDSLAESTSTPYYDHLVSRPTTNSIGSWAELQKREYPNIDPEFMKSEAEGTTGGPSGGRSNVLAPLRIPRAITVSGGPTGANRPLPKRPPPVTHPKPPKPQSAGDRLLQQDKPRPQSLCREKQLPDGTSKDSMVAASNSVGGVVSPHVALPVHSVETAASVPEDSTFSGIQQQQQQQQRHPGMNKQHSVDSVLNPAHPSPVPPAKPVRHSQTSVDGLSSADARNVSPLAVYKPQRPAPRRPVPYSQHSPAKTSLESTDGGLVSRNKSPDPVPTTREKMAKRPLPATPESVTDPRYTSSPSAAAVTSKSESSQPSGLLSGVPSSGEDSTKEPQLQPPDRKPRLARPFLRDRAETVPSRPEFMPHAPFDDYMFLGSKVRKPSASDEYVEVDDQDEYIDVDDPDPALPDTGQPVSSVGSFPITEEVSEDRKESPLAPPRREENGHLSPPVPHALSTETPDISTESIVSKNVEDLSPRQPPSRPPAHTPEPEEDHMSAMNLIKMDPPSVDYENVTLDMLNFDVAQEDPELYQNISAPPSEYANVQYTLSARLGKDNLGIFVACGVNEATDKCIAVEVGNEGIKLAESKDWWYMRIGDEEGWTARDIWEPTPETKVLLSHNVSLTKKSSFSAADNVKPKTAPPKPRRGLDKISEGENPAPPPLPSRNIVDSPPGNQPSNQPNNPLPSNNPVGGQLRGSFQQRPLPKAPSGAPAVASSGSQYVCDTELALDLQPWFYSTMDRPESEKLLTQPSIRNREFIIRERRNKAGYYALSVRHHYSVRHFNIDPQGEKPDKFTIGSKSFKTIPEIILYYQKHSLFNEGNNSQPVTLSCPARLTRQRAATSVR